MPPLKQIKLLRGEESDAMYIGFFYMYQVTINFENENLAMLFINVYEVLAMICNCRELFSPGALQLAEFAMSTVAYIDYRKVIALEINTHC